MPAPSPVLPSASTAPRCQTAFSASMPACTTSRRGLPSSAATRPTPQASCSVRSRCASFSSAARPRGEGFDEGGAGFDAASCRSLRRDGRGRGPGLDEAVDLLGRVAPVADAPRPPGRRRARCRRRRTRRAARVIMVRWSTFSVPQRVTGSAGSSKAAGRSSGSKPSALMTRSACSVEAGCRRSAPPAGGRWRRAGRDACACARTPCTRPSPMKASGAASHSKRTPSSSAFFTSRIEPGMFALSRR